MRSTRIAFLVALFLTPALPSLLWGAHEDDPKILHLRPAVQSPGYRAAAWGAGQGFALGIDEEFQAEGVALMAWLPLGELGVGKGNDCWGYTSPSGREYALFGANEGTHVVEITIPSDPVLVQFIPGPLSLWRDIKVHGTRAYAVSEGGAGIQVIDLASVDAGVVTLVNTVLSGGSSSTHNVAIDTESGYLYRCGGASNGLRIYSLANPDSPSFVGAWQDRYVHDAQVKTFTSGPYAGRQIAFCCSGFNGGFQQTGISIVDVTDKSNLVHRGQVSWPTAAYSHQAWLSADGRTLFVNDELDEKGTFPTTTYVIDVTDIDAPVLAGSFTNGNPAVGHNLYVKGDTLYEANYRSGLRVFDVSNPLDGHEIAYFDTDPDSDNATFNGMWSTYPYFSGGKVIGSDLERGLFVFWVGQPLVDFDFVGGAPELVDPASGTLALTLTELVPGDYVSGSARLHYDAGQGAVALDLVDQGGGSFAVDLPALPCGSVVRYYVSALSTDGTTWIDPPNGAVHVATATTAQPVFFADDFEDDHGWTTDPSDTATDGFWERGEPIGTPAQSETDHTPPVTGTGLCFFTGQTPVSPLPLEGDVDNGRTTLLSPVFDLSATVNPRISYWRWYSNHKGINPGADAFTVWISGDGGATWSIVEQIGPTGAGTEGGWLYHEFDVLEHLAQVDSVRMRFIASDNGPPSTIEAAIDDFRIVGTSCPDCDGNSSSDEIDVAAGLVLDLDQDGTPDVCQPLSADTGELSTLAGGAVGFTLSGGAAHADELYLLLGSLSGTEPGLDLGAVHLPLEPDAYFAITLQHANEPPLVATFGTLDAAGAGAAELQLAPGQPGLAGLQAHHAWIALHPTTFAVTLSSNALPLDFTP